MLAKYHIINENISWSAVGGEGGSVSLSVSLLPSSDSKTHTKMCYLVVSYSPSCHCGIRDADVESPRQGSEWRASLGKGTKELVQRNFHFRRAAMWGCSRPGSLPWQRLFRLCTPLCSYIGYIVAHMGSVKQVKTAFPWRHKLYGGEITEEPA